MPYQLQLSPHSIRRISELTKKNTQLKNKFVFVFKQLRQDPFYFQLNTHKVQSSKFGKAWSSKVTNDLRIIWNFDKDQKLVILVLTIGGHSGKFKVYN